MGARPALTLFLQARCRLAPLEISARVCMGTPRPPVRWFYCGSTSDRQRKMNRAKMIELYDLDRKLEVLEAGRPQRTSRRGATAARVSIGSINSGLAPSGVLVYLILGQPRVSRRHSHCGTGCASLHYCSLPPKGHQPFTGGQPFWGAVPGPVKRLAQRLASNSFFWKLRRRYSSAVPPSRCPAIQLRPGCPATDAAANSAV